MTLTALIEATGGCELIDLAHPLVMGMPVSPNQPGFELEPLRRHGDRVRADGGSSANELIHMGGHSGTHIDALCHVSHCGRLYDGHEAAALAGPSGFRALGVDQLPLYCGRGVMLDLPALLGVEIVTPGLALGPELLEAALERQKLALHEGDALLIRTGWARLWSDPERFIGLASGVPGPNADAARWMAERRIRVAVGETLAFEHIPRERGHALLPVHRILLVEAGIPIVESARMCELAARGAHEFIFILTPLALVGATGVPVRPVALVPRG
ncbi:MAG: cyclase family protein [Enhygromyxa sp.]